MGTSPAKSNREPSCEAPPSELLVPALRIAARSSTKFSGIDALRGLAALAVVIFHARELLWIGFSAAWAKHGFDAPLPIWLGYMTLPFSFGYAAVILFFVISGYCIFRSYDRLTSEVPDLKLRLKMFAARRLRRIYPVLLGALILTAVCDQVVRQLDPTCYKLGDNSLTTLLANLLTLQGITSPVYGSNLPLWSLSIEEHLYALFPLTYFAWQRLGSTAVIAASLLISVASVYAIEAGYVESLDLFPFLFTWILGAALLKSGEKLASFPNRLLATACVSALAIGGALIISGYPHWSHFPLGLGFAIVIFFAIRASDSEIWQRRPGKILEWLGAVSYPLYATHLPILLLYRTLMTDGANVESPIHAFIATLCAIAVAWAVHVSVERRFLTRPCKSTSESAC